jgi:hypothetical protein
MAKLKLQIDQVAQIQGALNAAMDHIIDAENVKKCIAIDKKLSEILATFRQMQKTFSKSMRGVNENLRKWLDGRSSEAVADILWREAGKKEPVDETLVKMAKAAEEMAKHLESEVEFDVVPLNYDEIKNLKIPASVIKAMGELVNI